MRLQEAQEAIAWVKSSFKPSSPRKRDGTSTFETTIRVLAGLLSVFHLLDGDQDMLAAAIETGLRLLAAFTTLDGVPHNIVDLTELQGSDALWTRDISLSEATTLSLEFGYFARVSDQPRHADSDLSIAALP